MSRTSREGRRRPPCPAEPWPYPARSPSAKVLAEDVLNTWSAVYLRMQGGTSSAAAAAGFAVYTTGTLIGRLLADQLVRRRGTVALLQAGGAVATVGATLVIAAPRPLSIKAGLLLLGLGLAPVLPLLFSVVGHRNVANAGSAIAAVTTMGYLGSLIGPPGVGLLADALGLRLALVIVPFATLGVALAGQRLRSGAPSIRRCGTRPGGG